MIKLKHTVVNLTIPSGDSVDDATLKLEEGNVVACALFKNNDPSSNVNVKIEASNSDELHPFVSYQEYQPTNGNHFDSRKRLYFSGGREIRIFAKSNTPLTDEFTFQMIFYIDQSK
ncbi:hypothetical protein BTO06_04030 [Tenacibaculum sp. SZ-18]|uniref:hypothetical protein n=1 Tax=Tenacibaculum sp. SZ-18 TaxID=754423 RepID=UPI000C2CF35C|nr:hypothetical protein [Tenacibaculum sp. SZ-18]AUC13682.1 hypothetical protein BTO06_00325 [Tenacibaculum sp. SZ-18]AUC14361.1 hypothetical protein BTO06_04030 [Tenacibaculum sp. SZ-18]